MKKHPVFWVLAGTTEGRELVELLSRSDAEIYVSLATEYGKSLLLQKQNLHIDARRLNMDEMISFIKEISPDCVIDTTHPYAKEVTENIIYACNKSNTKYIRLLRDKSQTESYIVAENTWHAAKILAETSGNIFLTCGSKEIQYFTAIHDFKERVYLRVLPVAGVIEKCLELGFKNSNIICMQGPFSKELNIAMARAINAKYLVTKDSGKNGGFEEKMQAAAELEITAIVIGRPEQHSGLDFSQVVETLDKDYELGLSCGSKSIEALNQAYFPLFVSLKNKKIKIFGAGNIAARRIAALLQFDAEIEVIAPEYSDIVLELSQNKLITIIKREYIFGDCTTASIVIAATNDKEVNRKIGEECKSLNIPVSVADNKELCSFFFPAVIKHDNMVIGLTSSGEDHAKVKKIADNLRQRINDILE
jgi:precorrin-6A/cobalt-precorrin-6A reductase